MTHFIIAGFVLFIAYAMFTVVCPVGGCGKCGGAKVVAARKGVKPCPRCKGTGRAYRRGAVLVHQLLREHLGPWIRQRFRDAAERRTGDGQ